MKSRYQLLLADWKSCTRCHLSKTRQKVVMARGQLPCDVLFIGEAPGHSEDCIGRPMVGPAGQLFDQILARALPAGVTFAISNLVACIPLGEDGKKTEEPDDEAVTACKPRLEELVRIASPKLIIAVGALARDWLKPGYKHSVKVPPGTPLTDVTHPAAVIRANIAAQSLMRQRCEVVITNAVHDHVLHAKGV